VDALALQRLTNDVWLERTRHYTRDADPGRSSTIPGRDAAGRYLLVVNAGACAKDFAHARAGGEF
jgi:hypothetical protein